MAMESTDRWNEEESFLAEVRAVRTHTIYKPACTSHNTA